MKNWKTYSFSSSEGHFEVIFSQNVFNLQKEIRIEIYSHKTSVV